MHDPIRFGIELRSMLDKSYYNSYEHGLYISPDGGNFPLSSSQRETDTKNRWTKKNRLKFCLFIIRYRYRYKFTVRLVMGLFGSLVIGLETKT
jgi:hypothetical protein